jgi:dynein heavy chain, axonemal
VTPTCEVALQESEKSDKLDKRLQILNEHFTLSLYQNVCRSVFEKDKLLLAFVVASKLQLDAGLISSAELRFLLTGGVSMGDPRMENPDKTWISNAKWAEMCRLSDLPGPIWREFAKHVTQYTGQWKKVYDSSNPTQEELPAPWQQTLSPFRRMMALRTLRADKIIPAMTASVSAALGDR